MDPLPAARQDLSLVTGREVAAVTALLAIVLALAYGNVVFRGRSLVYSNNYNPLDFRYLEASYGPGFVPSRKWTARNLLPYANFHDPDAVWGQWEPSGELLRQGLLRGEWPLWDPYVGAGAPAMTNLTPAFFFPPYFVMVLLGNTTLLKNAYFLLLLLCSGLFTHLFARQHGLAREASFFGALVWMLCGGLGQNVGSFLGQTAACLPFALWMTRRLLERPSPRRTAALALAYAAISLASFPPLLVAIFSLSLLYFGLMIAAPRRAGARGPDRRRASGALLGAIALSLGLVAFYYLPFLHLAADAPAQVEATYRDAALAAVEPVALLELVSPTLLGGTKVWSKVPVRASTSSFIELPYVGIVALLAALLAGPWEISRKGRLFAFALAAAVLVTAKLLGLPPVQWTGLLPGLKNIHFAVYFGIPLDFLVALLGAMGLDHLLAGRVRPARALAAPFCAAAVLRTLRRMGTERFVEWHESYARWLGEWRLLVVLALAVSALFVAASGRRRSAPARRRLVLAVTALFLVEGVAHTYYPRQKAFDVWRHPPPYVERLKSEAGAGRVFGVLALPPNSSSAFEVFALDSLMTFNSPRVFELYRRFAAPRAYIFMREAERLPPEKVLDRANVEVLALRHDAQRPIRQALTRGYEEIYDDGYVSLYRRPSSPRYYFTSLYRVVAPEEALETAAAARPPRKVVLETAPSFRRRPNEPGDPPVEVLELRRNGYALAVDAPRPGLVYCSESWFPGWRATVDGREVPILRANYAFRAVEVPAGRSRVELSYRPPGLAAGLAASAVTVVVVLVLLAWYRRRPIKSSRPDDAAPVRPPRASPGRPRGSTGCP